MADLPVIIVSYNTCNLLRGCLRALFASEGVSPQAIVVDNASADGSAEMVRAEYPSARLIEAGANLGFAAANNLALRALGYTGRTSDGEPPEYVLLLNPDTAVQPDALAILLGFMQSHRRAGLAGAQLLYPDGQFQHSAFHFPGLAQTFLDFFPQDHHIMDSALNGRYPRAAQPFAIDHPLGACMLARGAAIDQAGLMDEGYFMYVEEVDWCRRIRQRGWEIWCEPRARITHYEGQSTRQFREAMVVQLWKSRLRYFAKYESGARLAILHAIIRLGLSRQQRAAERDARLSAEEKAARVAAYGQIRALMTEVP